MAEALRSRDGALVEATAQALLLLDSDLAASELSAALFETEVAGRPAVLEALGETGSPRAVAALERLAKAATVDEDREGALAALRKLASEGAASDVATAALERLGQ
jgi:HEAT repeat protein